MRAVPPASPARYCDPVTDQGGDGGGEDDGVVFIGPRRRRLLRREAAERRRFGCLWLVFWVIALVVILGLIFGGWRKGTPIHNPSSDVLHVSVVQASSGYSAR
jgi:hypothetical protein